MSRPRKNYYEILGVGKTSSLEEIKKTYRRLALKHHPDKGGDGEKFKEIGEAYAILSDEKRRKDYDNGGDGSDFDFKDWYERQKDYLTREDEILREEVIGKTRSYFGFSGIHPDAGYQFENPPLDPNLWAPYATWMEKVRECKIEELNDFIKKLWKAADEFQKKSNEKWNEDDENKKKRTREEFEEKYFSDFADISILKNQIADEILVKLNSSKISASDLDSSLWYPCNLWAEKLVSLTETSELETFKNQMFSAIEKAKIDKGNGDNGREPNRRNPPNERDNPNSPNPPLDNPNIPPNNSNNSQQSLDSSSSWNWDKIKPFLIGIGLSVIFLITFLCLYYKTKKKKNLKKAF